MARVLAYYLPQFHPIPENDLWWGKGFTEWTNVGKAKPLFKGHYQPRVPADLGYYDLRLSEIRQAQAEMAQNAGIEGFCYWHYWFGNGKQLLERPFNEVLKSGEPDFPFCLCWANHSWSNQTWQKSKSLSTATILMEQNYYGIDDYTEHFYSLLEAFKDKRYIKVDGKPLFLIYNPYDNINAIIEFITTWRHLAFMNGIDDFHFVAIAGTSTSLNILNSGKIKRQLPRVDNTKEIFTQILKMGFDGINSFGKRRAEMLVKGRRLNLLFAILRKLKIKDNKDIFEYNKIIENFYVKEDLEEHVYPTILPQWDRSPRTGGSGGVYINSNPELFYKSIIKALDIIKNKQADHQIIFLRSWNEWAEGNYVEPDIKYGLGYLDALKKALEINIIK